MLVVDASYRLNNRSSTSPVFLNKREARRQAELVFSIYIFELYASGYSDHGRRCGRYGLRSV